MTSLALVLALVGCPKSDAELAAPVDPTLAQPLVDDPGVRQGVLSNGLHWYVEVNAEPADRAVLRLAVDAGSVLEDPDQLGVAHFVEHMAFNGTEHFPNNDLIQYLESIGAQFGAHLNAHTSFDETVYKLMVPSDDTEVYEKAFLVLEDWAGGLTFDPAELEKERGVVLEEWRQGRGVRGRLTDVAVPLQFHDSPYAERLPIGTEASLQTFDPQAPVRFWTDWYRPDLMAVVVVGDVDPDRAEALIREHFEPLAAPAEPRPRPRHTVAPFEGTLYGIFADPELPQTSLSLSATVDDPQSTTVGAYRQDLMDAVGTAILQERLNTLVQQADPPFLGAGTGKGPLAPGRSNWSVSVQLEETGVERGFEAVLTEVERLRRHGVSARELARAQADVLRGYESMLADADKESSVDAANEIARHFLIGEPMPGIEAETAMARSFVPSFRVEELNRWAADFLPADSRTVLLAMTKKDGLAVPVQADLEAIAARVAAAEIEPLAEEAEIPALLAQEPTPGTVVARDERYLEKTGFLGLELSNGVKVWTKETDFKNDELVFQAFSPGGESTLGDADVVSARLLMDTMWSSGVGQQDGPTLDRWLAGKDADVSTALGESFETIGGGGSPQDLETALQLVHAALVAPRFDADAFANLLDRQRAALANRASDPNALFADAWTTLVWDDPRKQPWTPATLDQARLDRMAALHADRFGDLGDLQFVVAGRLPEGAEALFAKYLGSLPTQHREESWVDREVRPKPGALEATVARGIEPKARVRIEWHGEPFDGSWQHRFQLFGLGDALSVLLREKLREELGGVYGVGVRANDQFAPYTGYTVSVEFTCDPERVEELIAATEAVVDGVRADGPPQRVIDQEKEKRLRKREEDLRANDWWVSVFSQSLMRGVDPTVLLDLEPLLADVTVESVRDTAKSLLNDANRVQVVLVPEPTK